MDPISASGIGLSVASLAFQVFAGCIKGQGYQLFLDAAGMPSKYQHLRVRLRIEQTRLLNWGNQVGLVEQQLEHPSQVLQLNRNLILDILFEIQSTFGACVKISSKYDAFVPENVDRENFSTEKPKSSLLRKTLAYIEQPSRLPAQLQWVMVKQDAFEQLITKLIGYNDAIESFLDKSAMHQLRVMQQQTHLVTLQLTEHVMDLRALLQAIQLTSGTSVQKPAMTLSRSSTLVVDETEAEKSTFANLTAFKGQQLTIEASRADTKAMLLSGRDIQSRTQTGTRYMATHQGKKVWIEWRESIDDPRPHSELQHVIEDRVNKLALLLGSSSKPVEFRAPNCLGYFCEQIENVPRYGLIYGASWGMDSFPRSLRELLKSIPAPSLTKRIALSHALAESLMYLHAVNWLHKGFRSDSILFPSRSLAPQFDISSPTISGFDFSRPDLPDALTLRSPPRIEHDLYRHPELLGFSATRSQKSHDIYSLGVVLVEISYWKPIEDIMQIPIGQKGARSMVSKIRNRLIEPAGELATVMDSLVGEVFCGAVRRCLEGGEMIGIAPDASEADSSTGAEIQKVFFDEVLCKLKSVNV